MMTSWPPPESLHPVHYQESLAMLSSFILTFTVFLVSLLVQASIIYYAWRQRATPGALTLILITILEIALVTMSALDMMTLPYALKTLVTIGAFCLLSFYNPIVFIFVLQLSGRTRRLTTKTYTLLAIQPIISLLILLTGNSQGLLLDHAWYSLSQPTLQDIITYAGPWIIFDAFYGYILNALSVSLLLWDYREASALYRRQIQFVILNGAVLLVLEIFTTNITFSFPTFFVDATGITIASALLCVGLFYYRTLDLVPIANNRVIETMVDGVVVLDAKQRIVNVNPAANQLIGLEASRIVGRFAADVIFPKHNVAQLFQKKDFVRAQVSLNRADELRYLELQKGPIEQSPSELSAPNSSRNMKERSRLTNEALAGYTLIIRDITEQKRLEMLLNEAKESAEADSRAKSDFLTLIGHDLRTPLSVILLRCRLLMKQNEESLTDRQLANLQSINDNSQELATIIDEILEQARLHQEKRTI